MTPGELLLFMLAWFIVAALVFAAIGELRRRYRRRRRRRIDAQSAKSDTDTHPPTWEWPERHYSDDFPPGPWLP